MTAPREDGKLTVALISEVYWEADGPQRLKERLAEASDRGQTSPSCRSSR